MADGGGSSVPMSLRVKGSFFGLSTYFPSITFKELIRDGKKADWNRVHKPQDKTHRILTSSVETTLLILFYSVLYWEVKCFYLCLHTLWTEISCVSRKYKESFFETDFDSDSLWWWLFFTRRSPYPFQSWSLTNKFCKCHYLFGH